MNLRAASGCCLRFRVWGDFVLTDRREQILNAIYCYIYEKGFPPTIRELCKMVGISSTSTMSGHLRRLEDDGYIVREKDMPRTIKVTGMS